MSQYHLQKLKVPVEMRIKREISTNSLFNKPTSLKRFDHRAPNSQMEGRGGTQILPRIHDVFPMKYTVRPEVSQRDTYQLRKERSLFRLLRIFLIVIQVFLQFQGQCVIITSNNGQNLKKKGELKAKFDPRQTLALTETLNWSPHISVLLKFMTPSI